MVEIGLSEDGQPVRVLLLRRNVLVGGIAGAGKSGILNVIIATLAACRDVVLWGVDLKGGMELQPWAACFDQAGHDAGRSKRTLPGCGGMAQPPGPRKRGSRKTRARAGAG